MERCIVISVDRNFTAGLQKQGLSLPEINNNTPKHKAHIKRLMQLIEELITSFIHIGKASDNFWKIPKLC